MKLAERKQVEKENKMKDMKILKELRQGPMKTMKDDEYAMIEEEVSQKGISGIKGYAKYTVEKAMRDMAYDMKDAVRKHGEHDQSSHGSWANGGMGGTDVGAGGAPKKVSGFSGAGKQGEVTTTPGVLDKLFGKGETILGDEFERKVTEQWAFEMTNPATGERFKAAVYDWMRYDDMNLTAEQGQKLAPMSRSENGTFSIAATSRENAFAVENYILSNSTGLSYIGRGTMGGDRTPGMTPFSGVNKATSLKNGDMVSWQASGGTARGRVEHIMREGVLGIPKSSFSIKAEKDDPAVLIRIYKNGKETETLVGHKMSTLNKSLIL